MLSGPAISYKDTRVLNCLLESYCPLKIGDARVANGGIIISKTFLSFFIRQKRGADCFILKPLHYIVVVLDF